MPDDSLANLSAWQSYTSGTNMMAVIPPAYVDIHGQMTIGQLLCLPSGSKPSTDTVEHAQNA